jgi:transcriptional regulator with PAS, ATPase and Fis domain
VPESLTESHLMGHVKGAFTGAIEHRQGIVSQAHTGTLFIDEITEFSLSQQAKLLRLIQTREYIPVGGSRALRADVRLIAASNIDPRWQVTRGAFREDLYYRIAVCPIHVPPLRDRRDDIPLLARHFLRKFAMRHDRRVTDIAPAALEQLTTFAWPGNVRQLGNAIERAVVLAGGRVLGTGDLRLEENSIPIAPRTAAEDEGIGMSLEDIERRHILRTLQSVGGSRTRAAQLLRISVRGLQYKLKRYGVDVGRAAATV